MLCLVTTSYLSNEHGFEGVESSNPPENDGQISFKKICPRELTFERTFTSLFTEIAHSIL